MQITPIKTKLVNPKEDVVKLITGAIKKMPEASVLAITSKIISYSQNRLIPDVYDKDTLIQKESQRWLKTDFQGHEYHLTIIDNTFTFSAGIDRSNAKGHYVLWPKNTQQVANQLWQALRKHYHLKKFGIIITDSQKLLLRRGSVGSCLAHCGFHHVQDLRGAQDLFGYVLKSTMINVAESLAAAAVLAMGEGNEQQPLCVLEAIPQIEFMDRPPTSNELEQLTVYPEDDFYEPILRAVGLTKKKKI